MPYVPEPELLQKYADILINFALNSGDGVRAGESVLIVVPESARQMYVPLRTSVLLAGAYPLLHFRPDNVEPGLFYGQATDAQLEWAPLEYWHGITKQFDHSVMLISHADKYELKDVDPGKLMRSQASRKPYQDMLQEKEARGKYTWTLALYPTEAMADDVGMTLEEYWQEVIRACYVDQPDPIGSWRTLSSELEGIRMALNKLSIESLHVTGPDADLRIKIGTNRQWLGGSGRNIPSFELFTSPDCRGAEGWIRFNQPLYRYGNKMDGIRLEFAAGKVVSATASQGQELLREMIATPGANRIGEFSLTDKRHSRIAKRMGETLFDENIGGQYGNTHIALGNAYPEGVVGSLEDVGLNSSSIHTDIISTAPRTVVATLSDGSLQTVYSDGMFAV